MNNSAIDVATGLIMMYLVLSLLCTVINEFIATFLSLRARTLKQALENMIDVPGLKTDFYNHGLIDSGKCASQKSHVSYLCGQSFAMAVIDSLNSQKTMPTKEDITHSIKSLPDSNIRDVLLVQLMSSDGDVRKLRDYLAAWFDQVMDRVSGIYKRKLKFLSLLIGVILAVAMNADTLAVGKTLWHDGALRERMVASAQEIQMDNRMLRNYSRVTVPDIMLIENEIRPLPVGWNFSRSFKDNIQPAGDPDFTWRFWLVKIAGLFITGLALSLGAPFWFDLLSKFIHIRGTGNKPDTASGTTGS